MDTTAYLTRQGWRGSGHALHPSGNGIKKPLLLSRKNNLLGVGKKIHDAQADQWWSRAFDETLRSINGEGSAKKAAKAPDVGAIRSTFHAGKWNGSGGLYGNFVRGDGLKGTLEAKEEITDVGLDHGLSIKRSRLNKLEKAERILKRKSVKKSLDQPATDPQLPQHISGAMETLQRGEPSTESNPDVVPFAKASLPLLKPPKMKQRKNPKVDIATSIGAVAANAEIQSGASIERGLYNSTGATALLEVVDRISNVAPTSHEASERRRRKQQQRRPDKVAYSIGSMHNQNSSENRSERRVKNGTKRWEDTKP